VRRDGPVLRLELARPEKRNAFGPDLIAALSDAFTDLGAARVVVLTGDGPSFSAGADLEWMRASIELTTEENLQEARGLEALFDTVDACPVPVVAGAQGHAFGGACGLLACCDAVVAARDAVFAFSEVRLGLVPAVVSAVVVARIGSGAARRLFVTGERFDAETALRIGLVHELADDLAAAIGQIEADILSGGPEAVRTAKRLARSPLPAEERAQLIAGHRTSAEGQEGLRAFLERRPPSWRDPGA
jgi:methylglutaconyl-CoA hydratase